MIRVTLPFQLAADPSQPFIRSFSMFHYSFGCSAAPTSPQQHVALQCSLFCLLQTLASLARCNSCKMSSGCLPNETATRESSLVREILRTSKIHLKLPHYLVSAFDALEGRKIVQLDGALTCDHLLASGSSRPRRISQ